MKKSEWRVLYFIFEKPWLASILIGLLIHLFFYLERRLAANGNYFSELIEDLEQFPGHAIGRLIVPFLIPLIIAVVIRIRGQYVKGRHFDRLRRLTYGTSFLGERIALGLESARDRDLSVMFIDIVDSTMLISAMSADEAKKYVEAFSNVVTSAVKKYSGYVDKFMGDGAMVVFGLRMDGKSDPDRHPIQSVNAGRKIIAQFRRYNEAATDDRHIHVRIGIESGVVRAGVFQNDERLIFTSIGIPVVIASRLEKKADKDSILITHAHHERLPMGLPIEISCGSHQLKGLSQDVTACTIREI